MSKYYEFDKREEFEKECKPLLDRLRLMCSLYDIPFFWTACVKNNDEKSEYINELVGNASRGINLKDDQIAKHISVCLGFDTVPKNDNIVIDLEEFAKNRKDNNLK